MWLFPNLRHGRTTDLNFMLAMSRPAGIDILSHGVGWKSAPGAKRTLIPAQVDSQGGVA